MENLLSNEERRIIDHLADAWNDFVDIEKLHGDEQDDFRKAIHDAQRIIMARPVQRQFNKEMEDNPYSPPLNKPLE